MTLHKWFFFRSFKFVTLIRYIFSYWLFLVFQQKCDFNEDFILSRHNALDIVAQYRWYANDERRPPNPDSRSLEETK